jgi:quinol monooxygenase YgiN
VPRPGWRPARAGHGARAGCGRARVGDRHTGKIVIVSNWDSEAAGDAAEPMYQQAMREFGRFLAEPPTRDRYEVLLEI